MKCTWTAESSRMKSSVQLGLLFLSLLIFNLHGEEVEADRSMEMPIFFDEPELHQFEMHRVRQTVSTEKENTAKTVAVVPPSENSETNRKRPRVKKHKKRIGSQSALASSGVLPTQQTAKVKRDAE